MSNHNKLDERLAYLERSLQVALDRLSLTGGYSAIAAGFRNRASHLLPLFQEANRLRTAAYRATEAAFLATSRLRSAHLRDLGAF